MLIAGASVSATALSAVVAFGDFVNQAQGIAVMATCALIYGVPFAWLESGYILLSYDEQLPVSALYTLLAIIRSAVLAAAALVASIIGSQGLPGWQFALIAAGLSTGAAVISGIRSKKMDAMAVAYIAGAAATLLSCVALHVVDAVQIIFSYAVLTSAPVLALALLRGGKGWLGLARTLFERTRYFAFDLPITSVVENGDRVLLSVLSDQAGLVAYNAAKVFFGVQREFNKLVKQTLFHRLYDEAQQSSANRVTRRFLLMTAVTQVFALGSGLALYWYFKRGLPEPVYVYVALCISTVYTLVAAQTISVAKALSRASSVFVKANFISLAVAALAVSVLFLPALPMAGHFPAVYGVAACYLLFYVVKTGVLRRHLG